MGRISDLLHNRSFWYAVKAGAITALAALPGFLTRVNSFIRVIFIDNIQVFSQLLLPASRCLGPYNGSIEYAATQARQAKLTASSRCVLGRHDIGIHLQAGRLFLGLCMWYGRMVSRLL